MEKLLELIKIVYGNCQFGLTLKLPEVLSKKIEDSEIDLLYGHVFHTLWCFGKEKKALDESLHRYLSSVEKCLNFNVFFSLAYLYVWANMYSEAKRLFDGMIGMQGLNRLDAQIGLMIIYSIEGNMGERGQDNESDSR
jgi:hypothetical protein